MSTQLMLLRHAKSDWHSGAGTDHARPLNDRGRRAAPKMGRFMLQQHLLPDVIACSTATRTRETCQALLNVWSQDIPVEYVDEIYDATLEQLIETVTPRLAEGTRLLVIGHNPGMEQLLHYLVPTDAHPALARGYPTCTLAQIALAQPALQAGTGRLLRLEFVKHLNFAA